MYEYPILQITTSFDKLLGINKTKEILLLNSHETNKLLSQKSPQKYFTMMRECCEKINEFAQHPHYHLSVLDIYENSISARVNINQHSFPITNRLCVNSLFNILHYFYFKHRKYILMKSIIENRDVLDYIFGITMIDLNRFITQSF